MTHANEVSEVVRHRFKLSRNGALQLARLDMNEEERMWDEIHEIKEKHKAVIADQEEKKIALDIDLKELNVRLTGTVDKIYGAHYYPVFFKDLETPKYKTRFLLRHLALSLCDDFTDSCALCIDKNNNLKQISL